MERPPVAAGRDLALGAPRGAVDDGFALAALLAAPQAALTQIDKASEVQVKAAYLYQFGGFVEWPPGAFAAADSPFHIGVIGADAIADELEQVVATRQVQGRQVAVRRLRAGEPLAGLQVLFVGAGEVIEMWDPGTYRKYVGGSEKDFDAWMTKFL